MLWHFSPLLAQTVEKNQSGSLWYIDLLVALAVLAGSFLIGGYLGRKLRMPDHGWKIGLCMFSLLASVVVLLMGPPLKLGIDLSGGVILVYEVDQTKKKPGEILGKEQMDNLIRAVSRRVNPGGQKEVTIRTYGVEQIEIIIPEVDEAEVQRIERIISRTGNLEFRILANQRNNRDIIEQALAEPSKTRVLDASGTEVAWWVPVKRGEEKSIASYPEIATRERTRGESKILEVLVVKDIYDVTGQYLTRAEVGTDRRGQPCVNFTFDSSGGQLFGQLTGDHLPDKLTDFTYKLGIILDGELYSAPSIQDRIFDRGEITGSFTRPEVQELVNVLNAGSLPAALTKEPISRLYSGPTLGRDTIEKSTNAMIVSSILVPAFMLVYYRFCGLVAVIALALNMSILFAVMLTIKAAFTLTGFAGLALTVGMAVDNNVLIYERLREELGRGATLRMAIRNAFQRASATIIDANLTTLIAATVLYVIGTDQVKGFAVTLWIGVAVSIYTAVFVSRVIFDVAEKRQWITKIKMLQLIGQTNINFMGAFRYCLIASLLVTFMAVGVSFYRGQGLFDIDFTGGVSVQAVFDQPQDTAVVRKSLADKLPDLAISDVRLTDEQPGIRFVVNTSERDLENVKTVLSEVFGDKLSHNAVEFSEPTAIEAPAGQPAPDSKAAEPANNQQSRRDDLPPDSMLALADAAEPPAENAAVDTAATEPTATEPAATNAAATEPAATEEPVEVPQPKGAQRKPPVAESPTRTPATLAAAPDPFAGGSRADLIFARDINQPAVVELLTAALGAMNINLESTPFELSNEKYTEGDRAAYKQWQLKIMLPPEKTRELLTTLRQQVADSPIFPASSTIGAAVAGSTRMQAIYALVASWVCIIIYLWVRFQGVAFGLAAVVALVHDVFVMLGAVAVSYYLPSYLAGPLLIDQFKINLPVVAAFLTIIGFSVNDTIVVFDRIREVRGKAPELTRKMINDSVNQTLSRTLLTSFTVLLVVVVLYLFGGEAVHGFAFALIIGVATGTYSSVYIASPILLWLVGGRGKGAQ